MSRSSQLSTALIVLTLAAAGLGACGETASHGIPADAAALVGNTTITKATLGHWMLSITGGDYFGSVGTPAPKGLVSEPRDYVACIAAAESIAPKTKRPSKPTYAEHYDKCRQLDQAIREQALAFLISVQWTIATAAEQGISVTEAELAEQLKRLVAKQFPEAGQFDAYLANHEWAVSDELYQLKRNLLTTKLEARVQQIYPNTGLRGYIKFIKAHTAKRIAETYCRSGYIVSSCRQYQPGAESPTAPDAILETIAHGY